MAGQCQSFGWVTDAYLALPDVGLEAPSRGILAENIGFSIWLLWSVTATKLPKVGFHFTTDQLFQLVAVPGLVGALMRFPYAFAVPKFGGRNWTIVSAALLLLPTLALAYLVGRPDTSYEVMLAAAAAAGLGGGTFA